jgi:hypothetical protein
MHTDKFTILGTLSSGESVPLLQEDRRRHVYIIGQTGTGKTGLLGNLMQSDLVGGAGFCFLDPHGDASQAIAAATPAARMNDVIYLDPSDREFTFAYNPLSGVAAADRATATANIVSSFKNIWNQSWGPRLEYILTHSLRLLLDTKDQSLLGLPRLLVDDPYREWLARRCEDPIVRSFWRTEYSAYDKRFRNEAISPLQNKIGILLSNPFLRSILCQTSSTLDIPNIMNGGKVLIVNLSKGSLGTEPVHLLGALLISGFAQAAEARRHIPEADRRDFTLYVDEFQNFATESFATILSESRKWRLSLVAANQHVSQLPDTLQQAVFGNAGTIIAFRVGAKDAVLLAEELGLESRRTLTTTNNYRAWLRLMRNGTPLEPRLIRMHPPVAPGAKLARVISASRARHMRSRKETEAQIQRHLLRTVSKQRSHQRNRRNPDMA